MKRKIIVVGAGITGVSIALHLAYHDFDVTLVEKQAPGSGATGSAFGWLTGAVPDDAPDAQIRRTALSDWRRLERLIPEISIKWVGALKYGASAQACLPDERLLDQREIASLEPALLRPPRTARYAAEDGAVDAPEATRLMLGKACELGVKLLNHTTLTGLCMDDGKVNAVITSEGRLDADRVVMACGTGITLLAESMGIHVPIVPSPAVLLRFAVSQPMVRTLVAGNDIEVRQAGNGDLLAAEDYPEDGDVHGTVSAAQASVRARLEGAESASVAGYSVAERPVPQDGFPVLGFIDKQRSVYVAVMHPAVTCAATIGRWVSDELRNGDSDEIPQSYRPSRFCG